MFSMRTKNAALRRAHRAKVNREKAKREWTLAVLAAVAAGASRDEVGEAAGVTGERVRQIVRDAG